jgi:hypothetical protein
VEVKLKLNLKKELSVLNAKDMVTYEMNVLISKEIKEKSLMYH